MAKKKCKRKRPPKQKPRSQARLERRVQQGPLADSKIVAAPKGQAKMSEVLEDFVEPYIDEIDDTLEAHRKLFSVAALAWNAALLPEEKRQEMVNDLVEKGLKGVSARDKRVFWGIVDELIQRKLEHFADNNRFVVDFELIKAGTGYHLTVISTMSSQE
jgi:hemerythrin